MQLFKPIASSKFSITSDLLSEFSMADSRISQNSNLAVGKMMDFFQVKRDNSSDPLKSISSQGDREALMGSIREEQMSKFDALLLKNDSSGKKEPPSDGAKTNETDNVSAVSPFGGGANSSKGEEEDGAAGLPEFGKQ